MLRTVAKTVASCILRDEAHVPCILSDATPYPGRLDHLQPALETAHLRVPTPYLRSYCAFLIVRGVLQ